jgi:hypothetical protein
VAFRPRRRPPLVSRPEPRRLQLSAAGRKTTTRKTLWSRIWYEPIPDDVIVLGNAQNRNITEDPPAIH